MSDSVVLLVEDNRGDAVLFREALHAAGLQATVDVVQRGDDAIRFLRRQDRFRAAPRPDVIVLDLDMPARNGREVLAEVAADPALNTIPIAILTTSTSDACVCGMYPGGRCVYFTKTCEFSRLQDIVRQIAAHAGTTRASA